MISFCISSTSYQYLQEIVDSINVLNIPGAEILINQNPHTLTKKKNDLVRAAKNDIVVIQHDYIKYDKDWFIGYEKFGYDWDVCMNIILNKDGSRYRDWCYWPCKLAPYDSIETKNMYVSGTYWVAKRKFMIENQLNENLDWGMGEDVMWSYSVRDKWNYKMNINSIVNLLKQHDRIEQ